MFRVAEGHDDYTGMGTTVVCALMNGDNLTIGHVGDSRLYLMSNGSLTPQTRDDTWAATILARRWNKRGFVRGFYVALLSGIAFAVTGALALLQQTLLEMVPL